MTLQPYHNILGGVYLIDADGNPLGVINNAGSPQICSQDYLQALAEGDISGHTPWSKVGFNTASSNGVEFDLWANGGKYVWASTAGVQMSIQSTSSADSATGLGCRQVYVKYLTEAYVETSEVVTLGGGTSVNLAYSKAIRVNALRAYSVGTTGTAVGVVSIGSGATAYSLIAPGYTRARNICYTVPIGKTLYVTSIAFASGSGSKAAVVRFTDRATYDPASNRNLGPNFFMSFSETILQDNAYNKTLEVPTVFPEKTDLKVSVLADQAGAQTSVSLRGWLE